MDCWQCNETKELKHFIIDGVLHYENCNSCFFEDLFGADENPEQPKSNTHEAKPISEKNQNHK